MRVVGDFHIHSPFARAVSRDMTLENLDIWARMKGITVMGTGDFTHPKWMKEIKEKLEPAEEGLYKLKSEARSTKFETSSKFEIQKVETRFLLTVEISSIYKKGGRVRRIHNLIFAPSIETAEKINKELDWRGNLKSDGRPILGLDAEELAKIVLNTDPSAMVVPAHCLLPGTLVHGKSQFLVPIEKIQAGDEVYTHRGRWRKVKETLHRPYRGKVFKIQPYYFRQGLTTTPEHPFYAIKTTKNCHWSKGICKPSHESDISCTKKHFREYRPTWISAAELEVGDVLTYPRFQQSYANHSHVDLAEFAPRGSVAVTKETVRSAGTRSAIMHRDIPITKEFCRLIGYFLAEGYVNGRDAIGFTFHTSENRYIQDVISLMRFVFGINHVGSRELLGAGTEITFYSKIVQEFFANFCYTAHEHSAATKGLPLWGLGLSSELQAEIFRGWWRGDKGYTVSRTLMNQMKIILLKLGIIPSIYQDTIDAYTARGKHILGGRVIVARHTLYALNRLAFFEDPYRFLDEPEFSQFKSKTTVRHGWIDENYVYMPIRDIQTVDYEGEVFNLEVEEDNSYVTEFAGVHNCWTPWFSVFGSMSGFDSLEECFGDYTKYIFAVETGLSSDPAMNWRLSKLDSIALISNSDSHSLRRIGREANVFQCELSYRGIFDAIRSHDPKRFLFTVEFFPEEGKYHYDGHASHKIRMTPEETKKAGGKCPVCGKRVTVGVLNRVAALADRAPGKKPKGAIPFRNMVPLDEIIAEAFDVGVVSKKVKQAYHDLIAVLGTEFRILLEVSARELRSAATPEIAEGIIRIREGKVLIEPGYDGEYGKIKIFNEADRKNFASPQTGLFG